MHGKSVFSGSQAEQMESLIEIDSVIMELKRIERIDVIVIGT